MEKLLVAYDGSEQADEAARAACRLAHVLGSTTTVVTVGQWVTPIGTAVVPTLDTDAFNPIVQAGVEIMRGLGVDPAVHIEFGSPAEVILELAGREGYGAIVLGHHGRGRIGEAMLGSVAKTVAAEASCPVLIVPSTAPELTERILVAVGDPEHAERVMGPAAFIARAYGGAITLLQVIDTAPLAMARHSETMMRRKDVMTGEGLSSLVAAASVCQQSGIPCDALQPTGQPADVIQAVADERDVDLIVMGRRDHGLFASCRPGQRQRRGAPSNDAAGARGQVTVGDSTASVERERRLRMVATARSIGELDDILRAMPPGEIDMDQIAEVERRRGGRFFDDPPDLIRRYLLDQQRRLQRTPDST